MRAFHAMPARDIDITHTRRRPIPSPPLALPSRRHPATSLPFAWPADADYVAPTRHSPANHIPGIQLLYAITYVRPAIIKYQAFGRFICAIRCSMLRIWHVYARHRPTTPARLISIPLMRPIQHVQYIARYIAIYVRLPCQKSFLFIHIHINNSVIITTTLHLYIFFKAIC